MEARFRLLGEVEVCVAGSTVDVGHARQRCVLGVLLVDANRLVPVDQLLDRVWSDRPPPAARNTLSGYVSRLRQVLAVADGVSIARRADGYLMSVDPLAVDLHRFHHLTARARAAADSDDALAGYERALELWRGEAFAGLDSRWLCERRSSLDAERLAVELDRNDLALARGRHTMLVGELLTRAAAHPLDERLTGQLMLALYRCGRQAEALHRYEQFRLGLAEELGADPSPPLQQLHRQLLAADPIVATGPAPTDDPAASTRAGPPSGESPVPRQLPAPPGSFTGRDKELAALDKVAAETGDQPTALTVAVVSGTAGVGKTALAVHWAHRVRDRFPDGQLYVNLRGYGPSAATMPPAEAIRGFLDTLGMPPARIPAGVEAQAGLYRSMLAGRRMLIVLDNARDAEQIRPMLPGTAGCLVLVTSRDQLTGLLAAYDVHLLTLDLLTAADARDLLGRRLGADRLAAEPDAVDQIVAQCTRLPLALTVIAARAATYPDFPLSALADELAHASGLDAFTGGDRTSDARTVFSWSYRTLGDDTARLFRLLGPHPGPDIGAAAAASLAGLPASQVRPLLAELTRAHLLTEDTPGRYTFHDLLRGYATEQVHRHDTEDERRAALHRVLDHYLHTAYASATLLHPYRNPITLTPPQPGVTPEQPADSAQALSWFTTQRPVLLAAVRRAADAGMDTHAWQLAWAIWTFLDRRGHRHDLLAVGQTGLAAAERLADPAARAHTHRLLAMAYTRLEHYDDAQTHMWRALDLYTRTGDPAGQAVTHNNLAILCEWQDRHAEALEHAERSLDLYRAAGHRRGQAHGLNSVGWYHTLLGDHEQAVTACQQALTMLQELDDRAGQAYTWDSLGHAHHHLGHHQEALTCFRHSLDLTRDISDRSHEGVLLTRIGDTHHATGNPGAARDAWKHALSILDELDHPNAKQIRAKLDDSA